MTATNDTLTLSTGVAMPKVGFGTWQVDTTAITLAARAGYTAFDSATFYDTEAAVAEGLIAAGLQPEDVFLTTKVWRGDMGYESTLTAFETSRRNFRVDVIDLYLIHWPQPDDELVLETWRAMEHLLERGKVRAIGVSNFTERDLDLLARHSPVIPAVNQIELHPLKQQKELVAVNQDRGIVTSAWSPLGQGGPALSHPQIVQLAAQTDVSPAQIILRWMWQKDIVSLPRSTNPARIAANLDLAGFTLDVQQMAALDGLAD